jgi:hypothetical protein
MKEAWSRIESKVEAGATVVTGESLTGDQPSHAPEAQYCQRMSKRAKRRQKRLRAGGPRDGGRDRP